VETNVDEYNRYLLTNRKLHFNYLNKPPSYDQYAKCNYNVYFSITSHLMLKHENVEVEYLYQCCDCDRKFEPRKKLWRHASNTQSAIEKSSSSRKR